VFSFSEVTVYLAVDIIVRIAYHYSTEIILNRRERKGDIAR
jgi:hypothetical protein